MIQKLQMEYLNPTNEQLLFLELPLKWYAPYEIQVSNNDDASSYIEIDLNAERDEANGERVIVINLND
jgi:hypothetical protein